MNNCIVCKGGNEPLVLINVRDKAKNIIKQAKVHPNCWTGNQEWIKKQLQGKNPQYFIMGQKVKL